MGIVENTTDIIVTDRIAQHDQDFVLLYGIVCKPYGMPRTYAVVLRNQGIVQVGICFGNITLDLFAEITDHEYEFAYTCIKQLIHNDAQDRFSGYGDQRFW